MPIRWCAFTGALMIAFVALTFSHKRAAEPPPGVEKRWWDGTVKSVETRHYDGKLATRTEYGEDGVTVNAFTEWNSNGAVIREKKRLKSGLVESKEYDFTGKYLSKHILYNGDEQTVQVMRQYWPNSDKLLQEMIMTEDGLVTRKRRNFTPEGILASEYEILPNATQVGKTYKNGKLHSQMELKGSGDHTNTTFTQAGAIRQKKSVSRLKAESVTECFYDNGELMWRKTEKAADPFEEDLDDFLDKRAPVVEHFAPGGKLKGKQQFKGYQTATAEEINPETGKVVRKVTFNDGKVDQVHLFREDGTLEKIKHMGPTPPEVLRTVTYDETGKEVKTDETGGEAESLPEWLTQDPIFSTKQLWEDWK